MRYLLPTVFGFVGGIACTASLIQPAIGLPSLSTSATMISTDLDLDGEGSASTHIVKIADITLSTDNASGLTLSVTSGSLTKVNGTDIDFQVTTVQDDAAPPTAGDFTVASGNIYTYATVAAGAENRDVYIRYTPKELQDPGNYSAAVQLSVADN